MIIYLETIMIRTPRGLKDIFLKPVLVYRMPLTRTCTFNIDERVRKPKLTYGAQTP
jgi:hypothetical protein